LVIKAAEPCERAFFSHALPHTDPHNLTKTSLLKEDVKELKIANKKWQIEYAETAKEGDRYENGVKALSLVVSKAEENNGKLRIENAKLQADVKKLRDDRDIVSAILRGALGEDDDDMMGISTWKVGKAVTVENGDRNGRIEIRRIARGQTASES
jgi:cell division protein FtsB